MVLMSPPLKRIYFDTNALYHWPHLPNDRYSVFGAAKWLGTELCIPEVVESELGAQFVRSVIDAYDAAELNVKTINKLCRGVMPVDIKGSRPDVDQLWDAFHHRSNELKTHFGISVVPLATIDVRVLLDMAISRKPPFEERTIGNETIITGLQDAAILFSILDHMKTAQVGDRCALVTADKIFHARGTRNLIGDRLQLFKNIKDLFDDLFDHIWAETRAGWDAEIKDVEAALNAQREELSRQIGDILPASEVGQRIWNRAKEVTGLSISEFRYIMTELPESQHRPPHATEYKRPDGSEVKISAKTTAQIGVTVEISNWLGLFALPSVHPQTPLEPKTESTVFTENLTVSITGTVRNGIVGEFKVTGIEPERY
jgi:hypothetical protein